MSYTTRRVRQINLSNLHIKLMQLCNSLKSLLLLRVFTQVGHQTPRLHTVLTSLLIVFIKIQEVRKDSFAVKPRRWLFYSIIL